MAKTRIAILGGGMGALTTAYYLTRTARLREKYDVTVYQMGWRLGGQAASGRNREANDRIEEHGLHIWMGFYQNAFATIRECYGELVNDARYPFKDWTDAFKPQSFTPIGLDRGDTYFPFEWPTNPDEPGDGRLLLSPWATVVEAAHLLAHAARQLVTHSNLTTGIKVLSLPFVLVGRLVAEVWKDLFRHKKTVRHTWRKTATLATALPAFIRRHPAKRAHRSIEKAYSKVERRRARMRAEAALERADGAANDGAKAALRDAALVAFETAVGEAILFLLETILYVEKAFSEQKGAARFMVQLLDTATATLRGLLNPKYGIIESHWNLDPLDEFDFAQWLVDNGARKTILTEPEFRDAPELRAFYDLAFGYRPGERLKPDFAAGAAIRSLFRIVATYKGAVFYEMQAGMGEVVVAPLYRVLRQRGVNFEFFHKVKHLELSPNRHWVQRIHFDRQVIPRAPYEPLYEVRGLPCWPSEPFWEQIAHGEDIRAHLQGLGCSLESHWCDLNVGGERTLELGVDFDHVVLGIGLGAFKQLNDDDPSMCRELMDASEPFRLMTEHVGLIPTFGVQLWMNRDLSGLGWTTGRPAFDGTVEPMDVWADMSHLLPRENWPMGSPNAPRSVQYFCGPFNTDLHQSPCVDWTVPTRAHASVMEIARTWLTHEPASIWPNAEQRGRRSLDWSLLYTPNGALGPQRLNFQWLRPNVDPTECCVASWHGSTKYRLRADESGFVNLTLAGAWTRTAFNATSVEAAVMSGMMAARAICGEPQTIVGESFLQGRTHT